MYELSIIRLVSILYVHVRVGYKINGLECDS